jgi:hypothetical protein
MSISTADIRALYTKTLVDVYRERIAPTEFLQNLFPVVTVGTKSTSIEVERFGEKVAIDVVRGTEGNRNTFSKSTEKIFEPPFFREYFDMTEMDLYDRVIGSQGNAQVPLFVQLVNESADRLGKLVDKIRRAKEIQCAQVLETGIVTMNQGVTATINYARKATSFVDLVSTSGYFTTGSNNPFTAFEAGCNFLRKVGRSADGVFNAIVGADVLTALLANSTFTTRQNLFNMALDQVQGPIRNGAGATFHGIITAGAYKVQLWAYPQFYDLATTDANGNVTGYTSTPYWNPKKVVMMPINPRFKMVHCAVPQLIGEPGQMPVQGEYVFQEFLDPRLAKHIMDVQSAPVPIPVAVDTIYTFQAVA